MINYKVIVKHGVVQQESKLTKNTQEQDIAFMIYYLQKKINDLLNFDFQKDTEVHYPIDENGDPNFEEDEEK